MPEALIRSNKSNFQMHCAVLPSWTKLLFFLRCSEVALVGRVVLQSTRCSVRFGQKLAEVSVQARPGGVVRQQLGGAGAGSGSSFGPLHQMPGSFFFGWWRFAIKICGVELKGQMAKWSMIGALKLDFVVVVVSMASMDNVTFGRWAPFVFDPDDS